MPEAAQAENPADRRRHSRRTVHRTAELMLRGANAGVDCMVVDESHGGVQVELSQMLDLPEELMIKFSDMASQLVRRCWANGNRAGYQYIEIVPAQRPCFGQVPPPPAQANLALLGDFIRISASALDFAGEPLDWLYPAERIHRLLAEKSEPGQKPHDFGTLPGWDMGLPDKTHLPRRGR